MRMMNKWLSEEEGLEIIDEVITTYKKENVVVFSNPSYYTAFIGVSTDNRAVYDYNMMVEFLTEYPDYKWDIDEAIEFIDYNASYLQADQPLIVFQLEEDESEVFEDEFAVLNDDIIFMAPYEVNNLLLKW